MEEAEGFQVVGFKYKEITARDEDRQWPSKKARKKYCRGAIIKMGSADLYERYVSARQDCLVHYSR